jgi:hypothetical protein
MYIKRIIINMVIFLFVGNTIYGLTSGLTDTFPPPPAVLGGSFTESWKTFKDEVETIEASESIEKRSKQELIVDKAINYLKVESSSVLTNVKVYDVAKIIMKQNTSSGVYFLLRNIDINFDGYPVSPDFFQYSYYPIYIALYEQVRYERSQLAVSNQFTTTCIIGTLLSNRFLKKCDISDISLKLYGFFVGGYSHSLVFAEIKRERENFTCIDENFSQIILFSREKLILGKVENRDIDFE